MANRDDSYEIGYGKPPRQTRFAKGQSGNPKGRPKGSLNLATILARVGRERVAVKGKKGVRMITKLEAAITQLSNQAASGQLRAIREFLQWTRTMEDAEQFSSAFRLPHEREEAVMASMVKRIRESEPLKSEDETDATAESAESRDK
jgi:hypothetical protein